MRRARRPVRRNWKSSSILTSRPSVMPEYADGASSPSAWERVKLARHADRPHALDYVYALTSGWIELHGDRAFGDDPALIGGLATFDGQTVMVLGHQKGDDTKEKLVRNFGMARP